MEATKPQKDRTQTDVGVRKLEKLKVTTNDLLYTTKQDPWYKHYRKYPRYVTIENVVFDYAQYLRPLFNFGNDEPQTLEYRTKFFYSFCVRTTKQFKVL